MRVDCKYEMNNEYVVINWNTLQIIIIIALRVSVLIIILLLTHNYYYILTHSQHYTK